MNCCFVFFEGFEDLSSAFVDVSNGTRNVSFVPDIKATMDANVNSTVVGDNSFISNLDSATRTQLIGNWEVSPSHDATMPEIHFSSDNPASLTSNNNKSRVFEDLNKHTNVNFNLGSMIEVHPIPSHIGTVRNESVFMLTSLPYNYTRHLENRSSNSTYYSDGNSTNSAYDYYHDNTTYNISDYYEYYYDNSSVPYSNGTVYNDTVRNPITSVISPNDHKATSGGHLRTEKTLKPASVNSKSETVSGLVRSRLNLFSNSVKHEAPPQLFLKTELPLTTNDKHSILTPGQGKRTVGIQSNTLSRSSTNLIQQENPTFTNRRDSQAMATKFGQFLGNIRMTTTPVMPAPRQRFQHTLLAPHHGTPDAGAVTEHVAEMSEVMTDLASSNNIFVGK